jgi:hypothetical protein
MNTATISLHRQNALIKFRELKNLVSIMKRMITLLRKVLVTESLFNSDTLQSREKEEGSVTATGVHG